MTAPITKTQRHDGTTPRGGFSDGWPTNLDTVESRGSVVRGMGIGLFVVAALFAFFGGCAQNTETPVDQVSEQQTTTPTTNEQDQATQGSQVNVWVVNAPGTSSMPNPGTVDLGTGSAATKLLDDCENAAGGNAVHGVDAGYAQSGITINVTTGGTTPSATGTATGSASAGQTPSQNVTASPELRARGEVSAAMPIGVAAPGGMVDQQATATGRGATSGTSKTSENELTYLRGELDKMRSALEALGMLQPKPADASAPGAVTPPTSQPAEAVNDGSGG